MITLHHVILVEWKPLPQIPFPVGFCVRMGHERNWGELWKVGMKQQAAMFMLRGSTSVQARLQLTPAVTDLVVPLAGTSWAADRPDLLFFLLQLLGPNWLQLCGPSAGPRHM